MEFTLNLPINSLSFGQSSIAILRELYTREVAPPIFPIGNPDLSAQNQEPEFFRWIDLNVRKGPSLHRRKNQAIKLWHLSGGMDSVSRDQILISFYELDNPTKEELNIAANQKALILTSKYAVSIFKQFGLENVHYVPLAFDKANFFETNKEYFTDGRITFNVVGKYERRKHHKKIVTSWIKRFGGNKDYSLQCAIFNTFMNPDQQKAEFSQMLGSKDPGNVLFLGFMPQNSLYNDFLNSADIIVGMSGGEGFGLPEFTSLCLGKHGIILDAHVYKDWANETNSVMVKPSGKIEAYDNIFFHKGAPFNQGSIFDWNEDEFIAACEKAIERVKAKRRNDAGTELKRTFTYTSTVDSILKLLE